MQILKLRANTEKKKQNKLIFTSFILSFGVHNPQFVIRNSQSIYRKTKTAKLKLAIRYL